MRAPCLVSVVLAAFALLLPCRQAVADGKVMPPRDYKGSLEEKSQEAIIFFQASDEPGQASEDLILKIHVEGDARRFAWVIPFPQPPKITKEDPRLFSELFRYVELRKVRPRKKGSKSDGGFGAEAPSAGARPVDVLSRRRVGDFDTAVVRENERGGLNPWLEKEGFQSLDDAEDVLDFYRKKKYVFACIKVSSETLQEEKSIESHPLRFSFRTGGRDGIYFPMKMTGLQTAPFDLNLYVFFRYWINDKLSRFGYRHRGLRLNYRDWDTAQCVANGGKSWSLPEEDPFLKNMSHRIPTVVKLAQKLHPGKKYYLTNLQAKGLRPQDVRQWSDDLWLFPYYTNRRMVPFDARPGGVAHGAYADVRNLGQEDDAHVAARRGAGSWRFLLPAGAVGVAACALLAGVLLVGAVWYSRTRRAEDFSQPPVEKNKSEIANHQR